MYHLRKECKLYIVRGNQKWKIEVYPDLSFSQTFDETAISVKTLHDQNAVFEDATITSANPANFNFTVLLTKGSDFEVLGDWLTTYTGNDEALLTYDIYVDTGSKIFQIQKGVIERATFNIARESLVTVSIQGTASKLGFATSIPGVLQSADTNFEPLITRRVDVSINGETQTGVSSITFELANEVSWLDAKTLHKSLYVIEPSDTIVPEAFVVSKKTLSGTIVQYLTTNYDNVQMWDTAATLEVKVGDASAYYLEFDLPRVVFTNRIQPDEVFVHAYDFRMTHNPTNLQDVIKY